MEGGPPVFPPGFTCPAVLWILPSIVGFRIRDSHSVSLAFPCHSPNLSSLSEVLTPKILRPSVWPPPRSLATTCGISVDVFSSPYLDVSVQAVPLVQLWIHCTIPLAWWVAPFRNLRIKAYLQLPEAYRSLSRLSSAPDAKAFPLYSLKLDLVGVGSVSLASPLRGKLVRSATPPLEIEPAYAGLRFRVSASRNVTFLR